jgi:hypothetical protein
VIARVHRVARTAWTAVAVGAGVGFVARDLLGLGPPAVALAWLAGAAAALAAAWGRGRR